MASGSTFRIPPKYNPTSNSVAEREPPGCPDPALWIMVRTSLRDMLHKSFNSFRVIAIPLSSFSQLSYGSKVMFLTASEYNPSSVGITSSTGLDTVVVLVISFQVTFLQVLLPPQVAQPRDMVIGRPLKYAPELPSACG